MLSMVLLIEIVAVYFVVYRTLVFQAQETLDSTYR